MISGSIPSDATTFEDLATVHNPTLYAADVFRRALKAHGVSVAGATKRGTTPKGAKTAATRQSMPLSQLATPFLKLSNNPIAETLVKAIGHKVKGKGTWPAGLAAISAYLKTLGVDTSQVQAGRRVGPVAREPHHAPAAHERAEGGAEQELVHDLVQRAARSRASPASSSAARSRTAMKGTAAAGNVHAKTGSLTGVTALSAGTSRTRRGQKLIFSSVFNGYQGGSPKDIEDSIADPAGLREARRRDLDVRPPPRPARQPARVLLDPLLLIRSR